MTRTGSNEETGQRIRKGGTPRGRPGIRKDLVEAVRKILLRDADSGLDWIHSFYY